MLFLSTGETGANKEIQMTERQMLVLEYLTKLTNTKCVLERVDIISEAGMVGVLDVGDLAFLAELTLEVAR